MAISSHCRRNGIWLHMDGARLWEATGAEEFLANGRSFLDLCALFDSIYVSFYKGLGGVSGAALLGSKAFVDRAQVWNRRFGGNLYSLLPLAVSCWKGFEDNKGTFESKRKRLQEVVRAVTQVTLDIRDRSQNVLLRFDPPVPEVSMVHLYVRCDPTTAIALKDEVIKETGISVFNRMRPAPNNLTHESYFEMNLVSQTL